MIDSKELRIGNLICNGISEVIKVTPQTIANFDIGNATLGGFKPIPLTEEWLMKFGFKKCSYAHVKIYELGILLKVGADKFRGEFHPYNMKEKTFGDLHCEYVHELQNIHYWLTRKELEIKK